MKSVRRQRRDRSRGGSPPTATVALAVIFALCLLGALGLIKVRRIKQRRIDQEQQQQLAEWEDARQHAVAMLEDLRANGLGQFVSAEPRAVCYIHEEKGEPLAFALAVLRLTRDEQGQPIVLVHDISYARNIDVERHAVLEVAGDLSWFKHQVVEKQHNRQARDLAHGWTEGILVGPYRKNQRGRPPQRPTQIPNLIPSLLLDLAGSLVIRQYGHTAAALTTVLQDERLSDVALVECLVSAGGAIPADIRQANPDGMAVAVKWAQGGTQDIYYDKHHQVLWQQTQIGVTTQTLRRAGPAEINATFGDGAQELLETWFKVVGIYDDARPQ